MKNFYILQSSRRILKTKQVSVPQSWGLIGDRHVIGWNLARSDTNLWMAHQMFDIEKSIKRKPFPSENIVFFPRHIKTWEKLAAWLGLFPSIGQAKKNGWTGKLSEGFSERKIKQRYCMIWLYVPVSS